MEEDTGGIFQSIRFWQGWAVAATAAALFTFIAHAEFPADGHTPDYVAVIGEAATPLWVVNADISNGTVAVRAQAARPAPDGERDVLWVAGVHPQRLGPLPVGRERQTLPLTDAQAALLGHGKAVAVSVEAVASAAASEAHDEPNFQHQASLTRL